MWPGTLHRDHPVAGGCLPDRSGGNARGECRVAVGAEQRELGRGRAGVERENRTDHHALPIAWARWRDAPQQEARRDI
jgi:hypothetical protein